MTTPDEDDRPAQQPPADHDSTPIGNCWDYFAALLDRIGSQDWSAKKTVQVAFLCVVFVGLAVGLLWVVHAAVGVPVVLSSLGGGAGLVARARDRRRQR